MDEEENDVCIFLYDLLHPSDLFQSPVVLLQFFNMLYFLSLVLMAKQLSIQLTDLINLR